MACIRSHASYLIPVHCFFLQLPLGFFSNRLHSACKIKLAEREIKCAVHGQEDSTPPLFSISSFTKLYPTLRAVGFLEKPTARRVSISLESLFSFSSFTLFLYVTCIPNSQRNPNVHHSKVTKVSYQSIHRSVIGFHRLKSLFKSSCI